MSRCMDLTGQRFGKLTVLHRVEDRIYPSGTHEVRWLCRCDCGNETEVAGKSLRAENGTKSCGCLSNGGQKGVKDRTGLRYGHLLVLERAEDFIDASGHSYVQWKCRCDCGREKILKGTSLTSGTKSCGFCRINKEFQDRIIITETGKKLVDLTGLTFNRLTVVERGPDYVSPGGGIPVVRFWCRCSCGNPKMVLVQAPALKSGTAKSCGCQNKDNSFAKRKYNRYEEREDFMIGYTDTGRPFFFDKADYERVKEHYWYETPRGYIVTAWRGEGDKKTVFLHRFIMGAKDGEIVDHINHDTFDNRQCNLRIVDTFASMRNIGLSKANTSGYRGVTLKKGRWCAFIGYNNQEYHLGSFDTPEEAAVARRKAEIELYGEHSYEQSIAAVPRIEGIPWAEPVGYYASKKEVGQVDDGSLTDNPVDDELLDVELLDAAADLVNVTVAIDMTPEFNVIPDDAVLDWCRSDVKSSADYVDDLTPEFDVFPDDAVLDWCGSDARDVSDHAVAHTAAERATADLTPEFDIIPDDAVLEWCAS